MCFVYKYYNEIIYVLKKSTYDKHGEFISQLWKQIKSQASLSKQRTLIVVPCLYLILDVKFE